MLFKELIGLETSKEQIIKAISSQHTAHAQLFFGPEGSGNLALALAFSQYVHCENPLPQDACGKCISCKKYEKLIHPDLHFVFPVSTTSKIKSKPLSKDFLNEWRNFVLKNPYQPLPAWLEYIGAENKQGNISVEESRNIIQNLSLKSFEGEFKILILWLPEMMHVSAANAILKILEEPTPKTLFLLVCHDPKKLLATIISRVQMVQIPAFTDREVQHYLTEKLRLSEAQAKEIAYLADGNLHEAYEISKNPENNHHVLFRDWMRSCYKADIAALMERTDNFTKMGKEGQKGLLQYGLGVCRESLIYPYTSSSDNSEGVLRLSGDKLKFIAGFAKTLSFEKSESMYQLLNDAFYHLERNANPKIMFLDVSLQLIQLLR